MRKVKHTLVGTEWNLVRKMFLKVSPINGTLRFGMRDKLSPRYVGPFLILEKIGNAVYKLALSLALCSVDNVFRISLLRKYVTNLEHMLNFILLRLQDDLTYEKQPIDMSNVETPNYSLCEDPMAKSY